MLVLYFEFPCIIGRLSPTGVDTSWTPNAPSSSLTIAHLSGYRSLAPSRQRSWLQAFQRIISYDFWYVYKSSTPCVLCMIHDVFFKLRRCRPPRFMSTYLTDFLPSLWALLSHSRRLCFRIVHTSSNSI